MNTWTVLWRLICRRPGLYSLYGLFVAASWTIYLAPGFIAQAFFDTLTGQAPAAIGVWGLIGLLIAVELSRVAVQWGWAVAGTTFDVTARALLQYNVFRRILQRPGAQAIPTSPGDAISRFRDDVDEVATFPGASSLLSLLGTMAFTVIALITMLRINMLITLVAVLPVAAIIIVVSLARSRIEVYRRASRDATSTVTGALGEMFGAAQAVQVARAEERIIGRFRTLSAARRRAALRDRLFNGLLSALFDGAIDVGTGIVLLLAASAMRAGTFTVGDFVLFTYLLANITGIIGIAGGVLTRYRQVGVSLDRLATLLQGVPVDVLVTSVSPAPHISSRPLPAVTDRLQKLQVKGLTYHYPQAGRGIADVSLSLQSGSFTVVTGRIGAGKTTLLRALLGLLPAEAGAIAWNGTAVADPALFFVPPRSAYTPQVPALFSETLRDNILLGLPAEAVDLSGALHAVVLEDDVAALTSGLDTLLGPHGVKLSGGQAQRTAAARMVVRQPELLVCDDLSSALDVDTEHLLWERLVARAPTTFLVVSHRHAALRRAEHIIVLKEGRVEAEGRLIDLLATCEEMQRLWQGDLGTQSAP